MKSLTKRITKLECHVGDNLKQTQEDTAEVLKRVREVCKNISEEEKERLYFLLKEKERNSGYLDPDKRVELENIRDKLNLLALRSHRKG